jgi:hypothetical protein
MQKILDRAKADACFQLTQPDFPNPEKFGTEPCFEKAWADIFSSDFDLYSSQNVRELYRLAFWNHIDEQKMLHELIRNR